MRKKVIVICMLDSVHVVNWLSLFEDFEIDFFLFPSSKFRRVHPHLEVLLDSQSKANFRILERTFRRKFYGYFDYFATLIKVPYLSRIRRLYKGIGNSDFDFVHVLEFQHSGYLYLEYVKKYGHRFKLISTNYGSDIYHFIDIPKHKSKILELLQITDKYSAECVRDYSIAESLGYSKEFLPVIPNSGGFESSFIEMSRSIASSRNLVIVKAYAGYFGRVELVIPGLINALNEFPDLRVFFYSVTRDIEGQIRKIRSIYPNRVDFSTVKKPRSHEEILKLFSQAKVYVGASISDGISTSFLEALICGTYPIQTNTSCANEWVSRGAIASIVPLDENILREEIFSVLKNHDLIDQAQMINRDIARTLLDKGTISRTALLFYS